MPYTKSLNHAAYALDYQNEYMAARGTFWESGGDATLGSSSTDPIVNVGAVTVRINDAEYSTGSETQVPLAANNGSTPRKDLIVAEKPSSGDTADPPNVYAIAGEAIESKTYQGITDSNGTLVADPPALPEVQPPAGTNLKDTATPLYVIYVPPGTADSTDLSVRGLEDVRKEGVGVSDVLRSGDAVGEIEEYGSTVQATTKNAEELDGRTYTQHQAQSHTLHAEGTDVSSGSGAYAHVGIPSGKTFNLYGYGVTTKSGYQNGIAVRIVELPGNDLVRRGEELYTPGRGNGPMNSRDGETTIRLSAQNGTNGTVTILSAYMSFTIE